MNHDPYQLFIAANPTLKQSPELLNVCNNLYQILKESTRNGEMNEGDVVFPHQCFDYRFYTTWLSQKQCTHKQLTESLQAKQQNIITLSREKENALEIGFNAGFSAALILFNNPNLKRLVCVDICRHKYTEKCFKYLESVYGFDRIKLYKGNSLDVLPQLAKNDVYKNTFDFVHIDGGHGIDVAQKDLLNIRPLFKWKGSVLSKESILLFDDTQDASLRNICTSFSKLNGLHQIDPLPNPCVLPLEHCAFGCIEQLPDSI